MILALETGGELASVAVLDGPDVVAESAFRHRMSLSRDLLPAIDVLLARAQTGWVEIEAVAVGLGPGSFTGLRIGLVTAKSLAWAADRPVIGISSLAALVAPHPASPETLLCAVLEARLGEFFTALYQRRDEELQLRAEPTVLRAEELAARLASYPGPVLVAGHAARFEKATADSRQLTADSAEPTDAAPGAASVACRLSSINLDEDPQARWIGRLAVARLRAGERDHPAALAPLYVRPPAPVLKAGLSVQAPRPESELTSDD
jgi:tRNA threonylcarbamoyladenosine biosynthesis protein TsaB